MSKVTQTSEGQRHLSNPGSLTPGSMALAAMLCYYCLNFR